MINGRRIISVVICGLMFTAAVHADMVSVAEQEAGLRQSPSACNRIEIPCSNFSNPYNFPNVADLDSWSAGFSNTDITQSSEAEAQYLQSFTNGPGSLNLCLSALIGLGLCSSAHFVKKLSFSFVPEWYHNGGPFQIGHSHAVTPESLCSSPVYCFVQPVCTVEDSFTQFSLRIVVSIWRKSQFTPAVIASRGPPLTS
ncbi:MAG: hypothetical protein GY845_13820 [Planctomycetes bacterium]|nr:hypothetical protein [Planctomycetota bacterium]